MLLYGAFAVVAWHFPAPVHQDLDGLNADKDICAETVSR